MLTHQDQRRFVGGGGSPPSVATVDESDVPMEANGVALPPPDFPAGFPSTSEDLHAWSIYRQNLNSDFTDSALGSSEKSPLPYGNFHLRETTMQSILSNPKYGPRSELGANMYTYLKFGLPRVLPPNAGGQGSSGGGGGGHQLLAPNSSGYDSTDEELIRGRSVPGGMRAARSEDFLRQTGSGRERRGKSYTRNARESSTGQRYQRDRGHHHQPQPPHHRSGQDWAQRERRLKSHSEANLLATSSYYHDDEGERLQRLSRSNGHLALNGAASHRDLAHRDLLREGAFVNRALEEDDEDDGDEDIAEDAVVAAIQEAEEMRRARSASRLAKSASRASLASRQSRRSAATTVNGGGANGGVSYRQQAPMLNDKYFPRDKMMGDFMVPVVSGGNFIQSQKGTATSAGDPTDGGFKYPHLQLRNVCYDSRRGRGRRILDAITFEARGGDLLAIMATKQEEGTALCDILTDSYNKLRWRQTGQILLNGVSVSTSRLRDRVSYARVDSDFSPDMSVRQTMLFHAFLREPGTHARSRDTKGRINALIEDLGLVQVKHTRVKDLTVSERQRLNVACQLLLDTDIVVLDQATKGMDIFDTFFLVEYLRQWAARGRIVIMTLQPPTYEILTMISKVVLLSTGRLMYYGKRREMLPYFAFIEYPCPAYKNPSDYYLDLVTLDDLSDEAMLESSQRIDQLASAFARRAEPLSDPGPPAILPPKVRRANPVVETFGLWIRAIVYTYPFNVIAWVRLVLLAGLMSILMGGVFMGIRWRYWDTEWQNEPIFEQDNINDRMGFHYVFMCVGIWPTLMSIISDEWRGKRSITRDIDDRLYSKFIYLLTKAVYSIPASCGVFLAYIIPGYLLAGIHYPEAKDMNVFYFYTGEMLLYLFALRALCLCFTHLCSSRHLAAALVGVTHLLFICLPSGLSPGAPHVSHLPIWLDWLRYLSPAQWMAHPILQGEFHPINVLRCSSNPLITENSIIKQVPCGLPSGPEVLRYFGFLPKFSEESSQASSGSVQAFLAQAAPMLITAAFLVFFLILGAIFFLGMRQKTKRSRARTSRIM